MLICILCCARGIKILENPFNGISSGSPLFADWWWTFWLSSPARLTQCNGARTSALTKSAGKSSPSSLRVELTGKLTSPRLINYSFFNFQPVTYSRCSRLQTAPSCRDGRNPWHHRRPKQGWLSQCIFSVL